MDFVKHKLPYTRDHARKDLIKENSMIDKPLKKKTKPDTKFQLEEIAKRIEEEPISDDDLKLIQDKIADKISIGLVLTD